MARKCGYCGEEFNRPAEEEFCSDHCQQLREEEDAHDERVDAYYDDMYADYYPVGDDW